MTLKPGRSFGAKAYLTAVPVAGLLVLLWAVVDVVRVPPPPEWFALAALTVLTGSFTVKIPGLVARLSVSEPFVFAATLLFGPAAGALTAALDALIMSLWLLPGLKTAHRLMFNISVLVVSIWASSQLFFSLADIDPQAPSYESLGDFVVPLYAFALCCFLLNSGLVAVALAYERDQPAIAIWKRQFLWLSVNYFSGASVAALIVVYAKTIDVAVLGIVVPLLAISYLTFRTTLGRLDDANRHLQEVNRLYLSTIETLAMAVDAKDQVTHGHIRRVQQYALGLAQQLGTRDPGQIQAIEAAALLHDMGKLAIPEYILNKPGKLSTGEFEKMKLHAGIGADILSAIEFPYPVVPIVRHHHENWDGSGYPDGLRGTQIPIGARILSVVDCFDALTSDRPYRPALSRDEALQVIVERRGTMYDPLVVDTFVESLPRLSSMLSTADVRSETMETIARLNSPRGDLHDQPEHPTDVSMGNGVLPLLELIESLPKNLHPDDLCALLSSRLNSAIGADGCALFLVGPSGDEIVAAGRSGLVPASFGGSTIALGSRIAGWVAATKSSVRNSDASLDLGRESGQLSSTLAVPLCTGDSLVGVFSVYSKRPSAFGADHQRLVELLSTSLASVHITPRTSASRVVAASTPMEGWAGWLARAREARYLESVDAGRLVAHRSRLGSGPHRTGRFRCLETW